MTPRAGAHVARTGLPLGLLIFAAAIPAARPIVLATLVAGFWLTTRAAAEMRWAWAAPIPVAVSLFWGLLPTPLADPRGADCAALASPSAVWRATEAVLMYLVGLGLGVAVGARAAMLAAVVMFALGPSC